MTIEGFSTTQVLSEARVLLDKNKKISTEVRLVLSLLIQLVELMSLRLATDSRTSSKPPSPDKAKKPRTQKKKKKKSKKSVGGQPGHNGSTLEQFEDPDEVIELSVDMRTLPAGEKYRPAGVEIEMKATVCEYRAEVLEDSSGNRYVAAFPANVTKAIQYGNTVKSLAVYMSQYQLIAYARVQEIFEDQFGLPISQGTLCNFTKEAYELSEFFEQEVAETLKNVDVAHSDETGVKVNGQGEWLHVLCTPKTTYFFPHEKRGREAIDAMGLLENFNGVLCHDHWKPYFGYGGEPALCNAHHLRELEWVVEFKDPKWAKSMIRFLNKTNELVKSYGGELPVSEQSKRLKRYREIIQAGKKECPLIVKSTTSKARGRVKQTKERNLLDRLDQFEDATLLFMKRKNVPFTNNQAELDIRMVKVQQKISGGFRSEAGARYFCRIRGLLITQRKRGESPYTVLNELFTP